MSIIPLANGMGSTQASRAALRVVARGLLSHRDPGVVRRELQEAVDRFGVAQGALAVERHLGGRNRAEYLLASERLNLLVQGYVRAFRKAQKMTVAKRRALIGETISSSDEVPALLRGSRVTLDTLLHLSCLSRYFREEPFLARMFREGRQTPTFLTPLLNREGNGDPTKGYCNVRALLDCQFSQAVDIPLSVLMMWGHVNLLLPGTELVADLNFRDPFLSSLGAWREIGLLGKGQEPEGAVALIGGLLLSLSARMDKPNEARRLAEAALRVNPMDPQAHHLVALRSWKWPAVALQHLETAVQINPLFYIAWEALGLCHQRRGEGKKASRAYGRAVAAIERVRARRHGMLWAEDLFHLPAHGELSRLTTRLGTIRTAQGRLQAAARLYRHAIRLDPQNHEARFRLATLYLERLKNPKKGVRLLKSLLKREIPRKLRGEILYRLGMIFWDRGGVEVARSLWREAIKHRPGIGRRLKRFAIGLPIPSASAAAA